MQDERLQELMDAVRGRYKAVLAMLGLPDALSNTNQTASIQGVNIQEELQF